MNDEPQFRQSVAEAESEAIDIREIVANLVDGKWWILGIAGAFLFCGLAYAYLARPVYEANVLVQIKQQQSALSGLKDLQQVLGEQPTAEAEIPVIRSRAVLLKAIDMLDLSVSTRPARMPLIGSLFRSGTPSVQIAQLDVPQNWYGKDLKLEFAANNTYTLYGPGGEKLVEGSIGKLEKAPAPWDAVAISVTQMDGEPGSAFYLKKYSPLQVYESVNGSLSVTEQGQDTDILNLTMEGPDPVAVSAVLNAVAQAYVDESIALDTLEAKKSLDFINSQLPSVQTQANQAQAELSAYQSHKGGGVDMSLEAKAILDQATKVEAELTELNLQSAELSQQFTPQYPVLVALNTQRQQLLAQKQQLEAAIRGMPQTQQDLIGLEREVKVYNEVYTYLLDRSEQFKVEEAGSTGNARLIDTAVPPVDPVRPKKRLIATLSLIFGLVAGVLFVGIRRIFLSGIEDPITLERQVDVPVYAVVPHSTVQAGHTVKSHGKHEAVPVLAIFEPRDSAVEALRSLRTSLNFALADSPNHIITLGGPRPGVGKSFVAVNLAYVLADAGKRILLIDADLRRGHLHQYFDKDRQPGLSQILSGENAFEECRITADANPRISFLSTGTLPPNPSELLMGTRFIQLLKKVETEYDMVVIDLPPYLAVTDGLIIAAQAGINLMVLRAGIHPLREIEHMLARLRQNNISITGFVLNDLLPRLAAYGYRRYGYAYSYNYYTHKKE